MQSALSRIWTHITVSISYNNKHYTTGTLVYNLHTVVWFQSLYQSFGDCTKSNNYNWYHYHFHVPQFFSIPFLFTFFQFYTVVSRDSKVHNSASSLFLVDYTRSGCLVDIRWSVCISKSQRSLYVSLSRTHSGLCIYHLFFIVKFQFLAQFPVDHLNYYYLYYPYIQERLIFIW